MCETFGAYKGGKNGVLMGNRAHRPDTKTDQNEVKTKQRKGKTEWTYTSNTFVLDLYVCAAFNEYQAMQPLCNRAVYCSLKRQTAM